MLYTRKGCVLKMTSKVYSAGVFGIDGYIVTVESDASNGLPGIDIVGLPDAAVKESKERVKAAIKNSNLRLAFVLGYGSDMKNRIVWW